LIEIMLAVSAEAILIIANPELSSDSGPVCTGRP